MFEVGGPIRQRARSFLRSYARYRPPELDRRLDSLTSLSERADEALFAVRDLTRYERRVFSQNGEDGVLVEMFARLGVANRYFVELGIQTAPRATRSCSPMCVAGRACSSRPTRGGSRR